MSKTKEIRDRQLFDSIALNYARKDTYPVSSLARKFQLECLIRLAMKSRQDESNFHHILELGCGPGAGASYLKEYYRFYTGIDYAERFIKYARESYGSEKVSFLCSNIKSLEQSMLNHGAPDLIFGVGVLHHCTELPLILEKISRLGNENTIYAFIEPYSGNALIELMRFVRKKIDRKYSEDQISFSKQETENLFTGSDLKLVSIANQGFFTPPFAQVIFRPSWLFLPLVRLAIDLDQFIQRNFNNSLAWNIMFVAKNK